MFKYIFAIAVTVAIFTSTALAEADFFGYVDYQKCDCAPEHRVKIWKAGGGSEDYHRIRCTGNPGYNSGSYTYTTGWYYVGVIGLEGTGCEESDIKYVYHVAGVPQQVDLVVYGPQGEPNAPGGGE
jgi:hypothetical protein